VFRTPQFVAFTRNGHSSPAGQVAEAPTAREASIPLSVWDDSEHVFIEADLPGLQPSQVDVRIEDDALKISAERAAPERSGQKHLDERAFGSFQRTLGLGRHIDRTRVEAQLRDGVLSITLHKRPEAQTQKVNVRYASPQTPSETPDAAADAQS